MRLTPVDILHQEFKKSFRGYNDLEVDEFIEKVTKDYEEILQENAELKDKIKTLEERIKRYTLKEDSLQNSLILAERTAEERINSAHSQAELIIKEAQLETERIKVETKEELRATNEQLAKLKQQRDVFRAEYEILLKTHLKMLEEEEE